MAIVFVNFIPGGFMRRLINRLTVISLFLITSCCIGISNAQNLSNTNTNNTRNKPLKTTNYNFNSLISKKSTLFYNPPPLDACPPGFQIWRDQGLTPPPPICDLPGSVSAKIGEACTAKSSDLGLLFSHSVVAIEMPVPGYSNIWENKCTGTIIANRWVLTAGHCVTDYNGKTSAPFKPILSKRPIYVIPWQEKYNGVPIWIDSNDPFVIKYEVKAIYLPYNFDYYGEPYDPAYQGYIKRDFVLLELEHEISGPGKFYQPIHISKPTQLAQYTQLWNAGYGDDNDEKRTKGVFHFRDVYFLKRIMPNGVATRQNEMTGSIPELYKDKLSAWSFISKGDSGGPDLYYDKNTKEFSVYGIHSGTFGCDYPGFFAPLPNSSSADVSIGNYYTFINSVINGTLPRSAIRCMSSSGGCDFAYVLNSRSNSVSIYNVAANGNLTSVRYALTGEDPVQITFSPGGDYAYIANYRDSSISMYRVMVNGLLEELSQPRLHTDIKNPTDIKFNGNYAYVVNEGTDLISVYKFDPNSGNLTLTMPLMPTDKHPSSITFRGNNAYVTNYSSNTVSVYNADPNNSMLQRISKINTEAGPIGIKFANKYAYVSNLRGDSLSSYELSHEGKLAPLPPYKYSVNSPYNMQIDGDHAFVADPVLNNVKVFLINHDGTLELKHIEHIDGNPTAIAIEPRGRFLYVTQMGLNNVLQYRINREEHSIRLVAAPVTTDNYPDVIQFNPQRSCADQTWHDGGSFCNTQ